MAAATHSGHCQACGRLQKLPNGRLAKHGYTITHGFFSGVCVGSGELPYEVSCDLLPRFIKRATARLDDVTAEQTELRTPATEPVAWVNVGYPKPGQRYGLDYRWERATFSIGLTDWGTPGEYRVITYVDSLGREHGRHVSSGHLSHVLQPWASPDMTDAQRLLHCVNGYNNDYATRVLGREVKQLRAYIAYQRDRIATWKLMPLLPVATRGDKQGFFPDKITA